MPYLHWETDRKRAHFAEWMATVNQNHEKKISEDNIKRKKVRIDRRRHFQKPEGFKMIKPPTTVRQQELADVVDDIATPKSPDKAEPMKGRPKYKELAQYLMNAAALFECMSNYRDQIFIEKYLNADPPLHPRRTLDQAYYWTLNNTEIRDRDQVVYRGTRATKQSFHSYDADHMEWKKHRKLVTDDNAPEEIDEGCNDCREKIRQVSRLVMVDQLWMWVLDATTVLTFFPRRYGANKHDISGVHKSIRMRIKSAPGDRIRSAFDLGLLIIEECCSTFFDRTKRPDPKQPQVIEQFAQAIADVVGSCFCAKQDRSLSDVH